MANLKVITEEDYIAGMSLWNAQLNFDKPTSKIELKQHTINNQKDIVPYAHLQKCALLAMEVMKENQ